MPAAISFVHVRRAAQIIHDGGVVAYPTEGVFGLGCDPDRHEAVLRILTLKERSVTAGLILIAADREQLDGWINPSAVEENALSGPDAFVTWVVCAVRITRHPIAAALCREAGLPLVSTSANRHGQKAAASTLAVRRLFGQHVDFILPGSTGGAARPSEIRVARTGAVLRAG